MPGTGCQAEHDEKEHRDGGQIFPDRKKPCVFHCFGQIFVQDVIGHQTMRNRKIRLLNNLSPVIRELLLLRKQRHWTGPRSIGGIREVLKRKGIDVHRPVCAHHPFTDKYVGGHGGAGPRQLQLQPGPGQERAEACKA